MTWHLLSILNGQDCHSIQHRCCVDRGPHSPDVDELDVGSSLFYQLGCSQDCTVFKGWTLSGLHCLGGFPSQLTPVWGRETLSPSQQQGALPTGELAHQQAVLLRTQHTAVFLRCVSLCFPRGEGPVSPLKAQQLLSTQSTSSELGPPMLSPLILTITPSITIY